jgi:hypothetical protein
VARDFDVRLTESALADFDAADRRQRQLIIHALRHLSNEDLYNVARLAWPAGPLGTWVAYRRWHWIFVAQWDKGQPDLWPLARGTLTVEAIVHKDDLWNEMRKLDPPP